MPVIRRRSPVAADADLSRPGDAGRRGRGRPVSWAALAVRGSLIAAAGTAALALAGPFALRPFVDAAGGAGTAGEASVAFVLDFGGSPDREVTGCVTVPASDNRYDALVAFTAERGLVAPTYASSGLLCSINGDPATGCGRSVARGYIYWSYFTGGPNGWTYADTGAFGTVTPNDVEGWRFQDPGTGLPNDPPPPTAPEYEALCSGTSSTPTTSAPAGGASPAVPAAGRTHVHAVARTKPSKETKAPKTKGTGASAASSTTTTSTYPPDTTTTLPAISIPPNPEIGVATVAKHVTPGAGPDPLIVGGLLVAVLAIAAYTRWRKRPRTP
jgi:hypothetical protein